MMMAVSSSASVANSSRNTSRRRSHSAWRTSVVGIVMTILTTMAQECASFTLEMTYKPPVKSTVKKLYDRRFPINDGGSSSSARPSSRKSAHAAGALAAPVSRPADFERRMRDMLFQPTTSREKRAPRTAAPRSRPLSIPSNVVTVNTLAEYKTVVGDESTRLVAVRFHATYCRACMAVAPHFYKLAKMNPNVVFVDVPVTETNASLHQGLGVPSLPYGHIYHPQSGLVEEMKLTRKDIPDFREKLQSYTEGRCAISTTETPL